MRTKFLIADDDIDDANLFCEALSQVGPVMECYKAENGKEVLKLLSERQINDPDIIFLDINMPIMNGWECLKQLKENPTFKNIPAIICSTSSAKKDVEKAYGLGALFFLSKPEDFRELCKILEIIAKNPLESLLKRLHGFESVKIA